MTGEDKRSHLTSPPPLLTLTQRAVGRLQELYEGANKGQILRVSLSTRGCSGMSYSMEFVAQPRETDLAINDKGVQVYIDQKATLFLVGSVMDYRESALESGFVFENPNEKGRCGCGESFHI